MIAAGWESPLSGMVGVIKTLPEGEFGTYGIELKEHENWIFYHESELIPYEAE